MINGIVQFLVSGILNVVAFIVSILFYPIYKLLSIIFPNIDAFWVDGLSWFNTNVISYIAFIREVFFNLTGFPRLLFNAFIGYLIAKLFYHVIFTAGNFIINAYSLLKRGTSK